MTDHQHEALHASYMALQIFETHVMNAKFVREHPDLLAAAVKASDAIAQVYQAIGAAPEHGPPKA